MWLSGDDNKVLLGCSQVGKATGFGPVIRGFESFRPSQNTLWFTICAFV